MIPFLKYDIGFWFQVVASIFGFVMGIIALFFTKRMNEAQIRYASKQKDWLNQKMAKELSRPYIIYLGKSIGLIFIILTILKLVDLLKGL